jgi:hypothetical protein
MHTHTHTHICIRIHLYTSCWMELVRCFVSWLCSYLISYSAQILAGIKITLRKIHQKSKFVQVKSHEALHMVKLYTCFEYYPSHLQEVYVVIVYMQPMVSSLCAGDCLVHRLRKNSFLTGAQDSHLQRVTIPETAYIQLWRRPPEDEHGSARKMQGILINALYVNK